MRSRKAVALSAILFALALTLQPTPSLASTDLSGTWTGTISGAVTGTSTLTIVDTGDSGTISGTISTNLAGEIAFSGTFVQNGGRVRGALVLSNGTSVPFAGRANPLASELHWHFLIPGRGRVDVTMTESA